MSGVEVEETVPTAPHLQAVLKQKIAYCTYPLLPGHENRCDDPAVRGQIENQM
jgi:hypothetical protein